MGSNMCCSLAPDFTASHLVVKQAAGQVSEHNKGSGLLARGATFLWATQVVGAVRDEDEEDGNSTEITSAGFAPLSLVAHAKLVRLHSFKCAALGAYTRLERAEVNKEAPLHLSIHHADGVRRRCSFEMAQKRWGLRVVITASLPSR